MLRELKNCFDSKQANPKPRYYLVLRDKTEMGPASAHIDSGELMLGK